MVPFPVESTADGSATFFSETFGESFHSRNGAYEEARSIYVQATRLAERAIQQDVITVLDICYGLGYNTAAALESIWAVQPEADIRLVGLELDETVPRAAIAQGLLDDWPPLVQATLKSLAATHQVCTPHLTADLLIGDARQHMQTLSNQSFQADVIFLDPFSPPRCPQLWTVDFLSLVAQCLQPQGVLATYSGAAAVRVALRSTGLQIGSLAAPGRRWPSTLASYIRNDLLPLSEQEQAHLATRAAVPYRDPTLRDDADTIQQRRSQEQAQSPLQSTSEWRRRWLRT